MSFTFDDSIPATNNNPSDDQPILLNNNVANLGIWDVDHIGFNAANGGEHKLVHFNVKAAAAAVVGDRSVLYTNVGTASTSPQMFFKNANATFYANSIRAFGSFVSNAGGTTFINNFNCTRSTDGTGQITTVSITAGATTGTAFIVIPFMNANELLTYSITGANTFTLTTNAGGVGKTISFLVLQA